MSKGCIQPQYKKRLAHRLKIIQGQIKGLQKAVEEENYCIDILNQSVAVQESLKSFDVLMLENHLKVHVINRSKNRDPRKIINEVLKIYRLNQR